MRVIIEFKKLPLYEGIDEIYVLAGDFTIDDEIKIFNYFKFSQIRVSNYGACYIKRVSKFESLQILKEIINKMVEEDVKIKSEDKFTQKILCSIRKELDHQDHQEVEDTVLN